MNRRVYSVGQVTGYIRNLFARDGFLGGISVGGEVSNCKYHTSGHIYFSLKDEKSSIACVMFAGMRKGLRFRMQDGDRVVVSGHIDIYERDGRYQLYASAIEREGMGLLYERFLKLKSELEEEGIFDPAYKKPIPEYALKVGVVTAPTGAAVRDIENISRRRNPFVQLVLYPALVQGEGAPASIVRGIQALDAYGVDVIIAGRGGGSFEDLSAFNEECVARAIFACSTPVISAVGHETDTTIADYVADLRAPTPSAAAELAVFDLQAFREKTEALGLGMKRSVQQKCDAAKARISFFDVRLNSLSPDARLKERRHQEAEYLRRFEDAFEIKMSAAKDRAAELEAEIRSLAENILLKTRHRQDLMIERLKGLNPLDRLRQGYSYVNDRDGHAVKSVAGIQTGDILDIHVSDGTIRTEVQNTYEREF